MTWIKLDQFSLIEPLGQGALSQFYSARWLNRQVTKPNVAIKFFYNYTRDLVNHSNFEHEVTAIMNLKHPSLVEVYGFGEVDKVYFLVMELMNGDSLSKQIIRGAIPLADTKRIFSDIAPALDYAHSVGVIHHDLRPSNILFDPFGNAHLSDFRVASIINVLTEVTGHNIFNDLPYISPEQMQRKSTIDRRSDVYSLGVILFEMLTGNKPFNSANPIKLMQQHLYERIPDIREFAPKLPPYMQRVINRAMAKDPDDRFPSAGVMVRALLERQAPEDTITVIDQFDIDVSDRRQKLRFLLEQSLSLEELRTLCFDLGIEFENLAGDTQSVKTTELIAYCERTNRIFELVEQLRLIRPVADWPSPWYLGGRNKPTDVKDLFREAHQLRIMGRLGRSLELFEQVKDIDPHYPNITSMIRAVELEMKRSYVDQYGDIRKHDVHPIRPPMMHVDSNSTRLRRSYLRISAIIMMVILLIACLIIALLRTFTVIPPVTPWLTATATVTSSSINTPTLTPTETPTPSPTATTLPVNRHSPEHSPESAKHQPGFLVPEPWPTPVREAQQPHFWLARQPPGADRFITNN